MRAIPSPRRLLRDLSLHAKLMLALAALIAVMAGGLAPVLVERAREQRLRELGGRATRMTELLGQSLAQPLWNVDRRAIDRQLAALAPNPELAEITVTAVGYGAVATVAGGHGTDPAGIVPIWLLQLLFAALAAVSWIRWRFSIRTLLIVTTLDPSSTWIPSFAQPVMTLP